MSVGQRCMERGYTFIWPKGQAPYFLLPDRRVVKCEVRGNIPYIVPGSPECQPFRQKGKSSSFCPACGSCGGRKLTDSAPGPSSSSHEPMPDAWGDDVPVPDPSDPETLPDAEVADRLLTGAVRRSLRAEARSLGHQLTHKPRNPYCECCSRGKMRNKRKLHGSFKGLAAAWGDLLLTIFRH